MNDIDGAVAGPGVGRERRERAMAEAALTLAEIGQSMLAFGTWNVELRHPPPQKLSSLRAMRHPQPMMTPRRCFRSGASKQSRLMSHSSSSVGSALRRRWRARSNVVSMNLSVIFLAQGKHASSCNPGEQDHPLLASSLQTAHNLSVLPSLVDSLTTDLADLVSRKIKAAFDMASLAREINGRGSLTRSFCCPSLLLTHTAR